MATVRGNPWPRTSAPSSRSRVAAPIGAGRSSSTATIRPTPCTSSRRAASTFASRRRTATSSRSQSGVRAIPSASWPIVTGAERTATVTALEAGETLVLRGTELRRLAREHASVDEVLVRVLAEHVAFLSERLVEAYTVDAESRVARRVLELAQVYGGDASGRDPTDPGGSRGARRRLACDGQPRPSRCGGARPRRARPRAHGAPRPGWPRAPRARPRVTTPVGQIVVSSGAPRGGTSSLVAVIQQTFNGTAMSLGTEPAA